MNFDLELKLGLGIEFQRMRASTAQIMKLW